MKSNKNWLALFLVAVLLGTPVVVQCCAPIRR